MCHQHELMDMCFEGGCAMDELREQMIRDLQLKGITPRTQKKYLREVTNLSNYFGKSPEQCSVPITALQ